MRKVTSFFFLATLFCCTFEKVHWNLGSSINLSDILALGFLACFAVLTRPRVPYTTAVLLGFFAAFVLVYLIGFYNLDTSDGLAQFVKGFVKFLIHFAFLATAVAWLWRRGPGYYWRGRSRGSAPASPSTRSTASPSSSSRRPAGTSTRRSSRR